MRSLMNLPTLAIVLASAPVRAWSGEGHQLIGWIAEDRLSDSAPAQVAELLGEGVSTSGPLPMAPHPPDDAELREFVRNHLNPKH